MSTSTTYQTFRIGVQPSPETNDHEVRFFGDDEDIIARFWNDSMGLDPNDIISDPAILGGKPTIRGTVAMILEWIASGASRDDILRKHPHLTAEDVEQALTYAAASVRNDVVLTAEVHA